ASQAAPSDANGYAEILVVGRKTLNTGIRRSEDDPQPYIVFDAKQIQNSQASDLESFLANRLPMNGSIGRSIQSAASLSGNQSNISLRGLGANQTLILVDGRRLLSSYNGGDFNQGDINGIPLSAIERIEVLPTTASGIYGGGATGGAINIITK